MSRQGIVHCSPHTESYFNRLREQVTEGYDFSGAYNSRYPKPMENFLEGAKKGTAIHLGWGGVVINANET